MCEFQKVFIDKNKLPICEPLNKLCTFCILGNFNNYKEAQRIETEKQNMFTKKNEGAIYENI